MVVCTGISCFTQCTEVISVFCRRLPTLKLIHLDGVQITKVEDHLIALPHIFKTTVLFKSTQLQYFSLVFFFVRFIRLLMRLQ